VVVEPKCVVPRVYPPTSHAITIRSAAFSYDTDMMSNGAWADLDQQFWSVWNFYHAGSHQSTEVPKAATGGLALQLVASYAALILSVSASLLAPDSEWGEFFFF